MGKRRRLVLFAIRDMATGLWLSGPNSWTTFGPNAALLYDKIRAHDLARDMNYTRDACDARVFRRTYSRRDPNTYRETRSRR